MRLMYIVGIKFQNPFKSQFKEIDYANNEINVA